jgi:DNA helicase-2/ATP-dependent DNA helicase PcrA
MEDGLFPGNRAMSEPEEMEEERRLCYVAMTRAMEKLTLTHARQRMLFGRTTPAMPSRFLEEVPEENSQWIGKPEPRAERHWSDDYNDDVGGFSSSFGGGYSGGHGSFGGYNTTYASAPKVSAKKPTFTESIKKTAPAAPALQLQAGESVRHDAFGQGLVISVRPMGGDALIEVAFDKVGTKKLMLKAASAHLTKE